VGGPVRPADWACVALAAMFGPLLVFAVILDEPGFAGFLALVLVVAFAVSFVLDPSLTVRRSHISEEPEDSELMKEFEDDVHRRGCES